MKRHYLSNTWRSLWIVALATLCSISVKAQDSSLSLQETIRQVAEVTNVLPLDVYSGTSLDNFRDWNCRYDLTYKEFRPNYALCVAARQASVEEVLECVDQLSSRSPKEKALTCAAVIAFCNSRRDGQKQDVSGANDELLTEAKNNDSSELDDSVKKLILQKLENELVDRNVAFPKISDSGLSSLWERNLREECSSFMQLPFDPVTATKACADLYQYPKKEPADDNVMTIGGREFGVSFPKKRLPLKKNSQYAVDGVSSRFSAWNNITNQLTVDFLCALVLAQSECELSVLESELLSNEGIKKENVLIAKKTILNGETVNECFQDDKTSLSYEPEKTLGSNKENINIKKFYGDCLIMNAYLKNQFIASRLGIRENETPICGNSSSEDVVVSDVVRKAIDAFLNDVGKSDTTISSDMNNKGRDLKEQNRLSLLETIRKNANGATYFSLPSFVNLFETIERQKSERMRLPVCLAVTYERFRPFGNVYEVAKNATRLEIVECLDAFEGLSAKEKAFVLAATTLFIIRSESSLHEDSSSEGEIFEPLTDDEKRVFTSLVQNWGKDDGVIFEDLQGTMEDWTACFRSSSLSFQKVLGVLNPIYVYSSETDKRWVRMCNEAPIVILYSMLAMETRCNLSGLERASREGDFIDSESMQTESRFAEGEENVDVFLETRIMRDYLCLMSELSKRDPAKLRFVSGIEPSPKSRTIINAVRFRDVSRQIMEMIPSVK